MNRSLYLPDEKCSECNNYIRNKSSARADLCGKCYLKKKREYRKKMGLK
tara:strand:- start:9313 stop:9459 length:147 start_codon:yes stop_codon:yes gene_type:complete